MKRVLITGGAGFVGSHLVRVCLNEGWAVSILYLPEAGLAQVSDLLSQIDTIAVDNSKESIFDAIQKCQPDLVFHLASIFLAKHTSDDIQKLIQSNITFGTLVLDAMSECGTRYLVNTGTSWQHFDSSVYNPVNLYAATKQAFEDVIDFYVQSGKVQSITLKLFDTYGSDDPRPKLFNLFVKTTLEGIHLDMSPGEQLIDIVHVDDVVNAYLIAAKRLFEQKVESHEKYAVSSGNPIKLRDLAELFQQVSGKPMDILWGGRPYREREVMVPWVGGNKLPGWSPKIELRAGISDLFKNREN